MSSAEPAPSWLVAWRQRQGQQQVPVRPAPPATPPCPPPTPPIRRTDKLGFSEPLPWPDDGGVRREPVLDTDHSPPRLVRRVGWLRCMRCGRSFWSEDVVNLRLCVGRDRTCRE